MSLDHEEYIQDLERQIANLKTDAERQKALTHSYIQKVLNANKEIVRLKAEIDYLKDKGAPIS